jgi:DNA repair ATPase RecN
VAEIEELAHNESKEEIGRMLSGQHLTPEALRNAAELMRAAQATE